MVNVTLRLAQVNFHAQDNLKAAHMHDHVEQGMLTCHRGSHQNVLPTWWVSPGNSCGLLVITAWSYPHCHQDHYKSI